jgi:N-acetylglucosamine kinase-like BadF-type ATPase
MARLFIGLDLGGSGTRAALVDAEGNVLATGTALTGLLGGGGAASRRHLGRALDAALAAIRPLVGDQACRVFAGTRGLSIPGRRDSLVLELKLRLPAAEVRVSNDALIGLWGGLAGRQGVAVVAGAGSIALARSADGREGRAGGWGYVLGDEGSGYWIGREALATYLRTLEGRSSPGQMTDLVAKTLGRSSVIESLGWLYGGQDQVARLAELAPLVSQAAGGGDGCASEILAQAGRALAEIAGAAARQVWGALLPESLPVTGCGGVWTAGPALDDAFALALAEALPGALRVAPRLTAVGGAILLAMGADRTPLDDDVLNGVAAGLAAFNRL